MLSSIVGLEPYLNVAGGPWLGLALGTVVLMPVLYFAVVRRVCQTNKSRILGVAALWAGLWVLAFGDVVVTAFHAKQYCESEAGRHVYNTAQSDSIVGPLDINRLARHGIKFVETGRGIALRKKVLVNGQVHEEKIPELTSQYEVTDEDIRRRHSIYSLHHIVRNRLTHEVLGEDIRFIIGHGWMDNILIGVTGFRAHLVRCYSREGPGKGPPLEPTELVTSVLNPQCKAGGCNP